MAVTNRTTEDQWSVTVAHVTVALLSVSGSVLFCAVSDSEQPRLPSSLSAHGQSLDHVAQSQLTSLVGSDHGYMEQLYTFSFDEAARTEIVVSYLALTPGTPLLANGWTWQPVIELNAKVAHPDQVVLDYAIVRLRAKIGYTTIAFHLMPQSFSLSDLQVTYETILGRPLDPRNFRRRVVSSRLLQAENRLRREGSHRPAALYRFAGNHDPASFLTPAAPVTRDRHQTAE
jgi:8-oxo-dGTP diphosphatase